MDLEPGGDRSPSSAFAGRRRQQTAQLSSAIFSRVLQMPSGLATPSRPRSGPGGDLIALLDRGDPSSSLLLLQSVSRLSLQRAPGFVCSQLPRRARELSPRQSSCGTDSEAAAGQPGNGPPSTPAGECRRWADSTRPRRICAAHRSPTASAPGGSLLILQPAPSPGKKRSGPVLKHAEHRAPFQGTEAISAVACAASALHNRCRHLQWEWGCCAADSGAPSVISCHQKANQPLRQPRDGLLEDLLAESSLTTSQAAPRKKLSMKSNQRIVASSDILV